MKTDADLFTDPTIDWSTCTFEGARLDQHRKFRALPFAKKIAVIELLNDRARQFSAYSKESPSAAPAA